MLRLTTLKDYKNSQSLQQPIAQMRKTFADVFSAHYAKRIAPELKKGIEAKTISTAADLKTSTNTILQGFSDVLNKEKYFETDPNKYSNEKALETRFKKIYSTVGFDDEEAFLLAFHDLNIPESKSAQHHYEKIKSRLKESDRGEAEAYLKCFSKINRELKEVNFVALVDDKNHMRGFAIIHILQKGNQQILHVRQAAMIDKNRGYAGIFTRYLVDHYPKAIYEANQRRANSVPMKDKLQEEKLIQKIPAVLDYNDKFYLGLRGTDTLLKSFQLHSKEPIKKLGKYFDTNCITTFFNQSKLYRESFADDNFSHKKKSMLRKNSISFR